MIGKMLNSLLLGGMVSMSVQGAVTVVSQDFTTGGVIEVDVSTSLHNFFVGAPAGGTITDVVISANVTGSGDSINPDGTLNGSGTAYFGELSLILFSPTGTSLELVSEGTWDNSTSSVALADLFFSDSGSAQEGTFASGTYAPTGGSLSIFDGEFAQGTWGIQIGDNVAADPKSLNGFDFTVTTSASAIPEPSTYPLLLGASAFIIAASRRRVKIRSSDN